MHGNIGTTGVKSKFLRSYPGPRGPHLNQLTMTTMSGAYEDKDQQSIHPRVVNGRTMHKKVNTAKARKE